MRPACEPFQYPTNAFCRGVLVGGRIHREQFDNDDIPAGSLGYAYAVREGTATLYSHYKQGSSWAIMREGSPYVYKDVNLGLFNSMRHCHC